MTSATPDEAAKKCAGLGFFKKFACKMRHGLKKMFGREVADQLIREWQGEQEMSGLLVLNAKSFEQKWAKKYAGHGLENVQNMKAEH